MQVDSRGFINAETSTRSRIILNSKTNGSVMEVEVHIDQPFTFVRIYVVVNLFAVLFFQYLLCCFFKEIVDLISRLLVIQKLFPTIDLKEKDFCSSGSNVSFALYLFVENLSIVSAKNLFFKGTNEGKVRLKHNATRHQHCEKIIMINLDQFLDEVQFIADYAVLKDHYVIVKMNLTAKITSRYHSHFTNYNDSYVCPIFGFQIDKFSPMKPSFPKKQFTFFSFKNRCSRRV